jgi:hypothetical protein
VYALNLLSEEGPNTSMSWLLWVVLGIFVVIVLVGWWVSRNKGEQVEVKEEAPAAPKAKKSADDLTTLEGIGPKVAKVLNGAGIASYADLAGADAAKVQEALNAAGMQYMNPEGWIAQAKLAAAGDMDGLAKLQDELKGGRKA